MTKNHWLFYTGLIAIIGALMTALGEWLMLYSPEGLYGMANGHQNFLYPSPEQLKLGFFIGVLSAPIYILGYWHVCKMLFLSPKWQWIIMSLAVFGFTIGNVWLGTNAYIGLVVQAIDQSTSSVTDLKLIQNQLEHFSDPLLQVVRFCVLSLSLVLIWKTTTTKTLYPKWMVAFTPFPIILYIFGLYFLIPSIGNYFLPAALNVAHTVFFSLSTYFAYRSWKN